MAATKTEDGVAFPARAYAFVPDPEKSSTWKLRVWEDLEKKVTIRQLGRAAAAFSPGGFRGQRVQIPSGQVAAVKAKLRALYRGQGVEPENIPRSIREALGARADKFMSHWIMEKEPTMRILAAGVQPIDEKAFDGEKGEVTLTVIKPGFNTSKTRFYPAETLRRDAQVFDGVKMFADHQTEAAEAEQPEDSVNRWVGQVKKVWAEDDGTIKATAAVIDKPFKDKLVELSKHGLLSEMGNSIRALGEGVKAKVEDIQTTVVERLLKGRSVDFVTYPGAGGQVEALEADEGDETDVDLIDEQGLRDARPDLVEIIEAGAKARPNSNEEEEEGDTMPEETAKLKTDLEASNTALKEVTDERDELKEERDKAQRETAKAEAQTKIKEAIANAKDLPEPAQKKLSQQFADAESADGIEDAIKTEREYIASLPGGTGVADLGEADAAEVVKADEAARQDLRESYIRSHLNDGKSQEEAERLADLAVNA
jgi:hypothetical protein